MFRWRSQYRSSMQSSGSVGIELGHFDFWQRTYAAALLHLEVNQLRLDLEPAGGGPDLIMTASNDRWTGRVGIHITGSRLLGSDELAAKKRAAVIHLVRKYVRDHHG